MISFKGNELLSLKNISMSLGLAVATFMGAQTLQAAVLGDLKTSGKKIDKVVVADNGATLNVAGRQHNLDLIGAAMRKKRVAIVDVKVYVAQLFGQAYPGESRNQRFDYSENGALNSLDKIESVAIQLTFVRDVEANTVQSSFAEALAANKIDISTPAISQFLAKVSEGGDAIDGKTITIVGEKLGNGSEIITYENNQGKSDSIIGPVGFVKAVMSIWLGVPADSGLQKFKKALVTKPAGV